MTVPRDDKPYLQFNFTLEVEGSPIGGFQEISGIGTEVTTTEYRHGNDPDNNVRKLSGLNKVTDVTLKRGAMGTRHLFDWIEQVRSGDKAALKSMQIALMSEDRSNSDPVMVWKLKNARATKITYGPLNAKGSDVAMEEVVIAYERLDLE